MGNEHTTFLERFAKGLFLTKQKVRMQEAVETVEKTRKKAHNDLENAVRELSISRKNRHDH